MVARSVLEPEEMRGRLAPELRFPVFEAGSAILPGGADMAVIGEGEADLGIALHELDLDSQLATLPDVIGIQEGNNIRARD